MFQWQQQIEKGLFFHLQWWGGGLPIFSPTVKGLPILSTITTKSLSPLPVLNEHSRMQLISLSTNIDIQRLIKKGTIYMNLIHNLNYSKQKQKTSIYKARHPTPRYTVCHQPHVKDLFILHRNLNQSIVWTGRFPYLVSLYVQQAGCVWAGHIWGLMMLSCLLRFGLCLSCVSILGGSSRSSESLQNKP